MMTSTPPTPPPESADEKRRGELRTGVVYPILVLIVGMFLTGLWGVVQMYGEVKALANANDDLKKEVEKANNALKAEVDKVKKEAADERAAREAARKENDDKAERRNGKLDDRIAGLEKAIIEVTATLKGIQSGVSDMRDDMKDMRKKLDRLGHKG